MDVDAIREALRSKPFRTFELCLADGRRLAVAHPDFLMVEKRRVTYISREDGSTSLIEPLLIVSVETPGGNLGP